MKLNEYQKTAIGVAVLDYMLYVVSHHGETPEDDHELSLYGLADKHLYFTISMVIESGKPDQTILDNLIKEEWGIDDVIHYIEETY